MTAPFAPSFRTVDQQTGYITPASAGGAMTALPPVDRAMYDAVCAQRDRLAADLANARGELDNTMQSMRDLGAMVRDLTSQNGMWHAERDEMRERADEQRERAESYLATIDELQAEVRSLLGKLAAAESERDTANARAAVL